MVRTLPLLAIVVLFGSAGAQAQRSGGRPVGRPGGGIGRPVTGLPGHTVRTPLDRWFRMSPEQRERELGKLPPERQKAVRQRLDRFTSLPKEEQARQLESYEVFSQLPSEKQEVVRRQLRRLADAPPERRRVLTTEFDHLRTLDEDERRTRLQSDEFRDRYSAEEQEMLRQLSQSLPVNRK